MKVFLITAATAVLSCSAAQLETPESCSTAFSWDATCVPTASKRWFHLIEGGLRAREGSDLLSSSDECCRFSSWLCLESDRDPTRGFWDAWWTSWETNCNVATVPASPELVWDWMPWVSFPHMSLVYLLLQRPAQEQRVRLIWESAACPKAASGTQINLDTTKLSESQNLALLSGCSHAIHGASYSSCTLWLGDLLRIEFSIKGSAIGKYIDGITTGIHFVGGIGVKLCVHKCKCRSKDICRWKTRFCYRITLNSDKICMIHSVSESIDDLSDKWSGIWKPCCLALRFWLVTNVMYAAALYRNIGREENLI